MIKMNIFGQKWNGNSSSKKNISNLKRWCGAKNKHMEKVLELNKQTNKQTKTYILDKKNLTSSHFGLYVNEKISHFQLIYKNHLQLLCTWKIKKKPNANVNKKKLPQNRLIYSFHPFIWSMSVKFFKRKIMPLILFYFIR